MSNSVQVAPSIFYSHAVFFCIRIDFGFVETVVHAISVRLPSNM